MALATKIEWSQTTTELHLTMHFAAAARNHVEVTRSMVKVNIPQRRPFVIDLAEDVDDVETKIELLQSRIELHLKKVKMHFQVNALPLLSLRSRIVTQ